MKPKHTPGPWRIESDGSSMAMGGQVCIVSPAPDNASRDEEQANARLIAAAPQMFAALCHIYDNMADRGELKNDDGKEWGEVKAVRKAIEAAGYKPHKRTGAFNLGYDEKDQTWDDGRPRIPKGGV